MRRSAWRKIALVCLSAVIAGCAFEPERDRVIVFQPDPSQPSDRCVSLAGVRRTEVLDEQNVMFYLRNGDIYRNWLPRRCAGLSSRNAFSYETTAGRLCRGEMITVIDPGVLGSIPGARCALGGFYPVTDMEAEALATEIERVRELGLEN